MKKWIIFALALMLVLAFTGCDKHTSDAPTAPTQSTPTTIPTTTPTAPTGNGDQLHILDFFRVEGITEDGMILLVGHIGGEHIYAYLKSDMKVDRYDTVYVDYLKSELKPQTGKFTHVDGGEKEYSYVFESILSIRFPVSGEPTYG